MNQITLTPEELETASASVHESYIAQKHTQGITSRKNEDGEELMVPYDQLSEKSKDLDRASVRGALAVINDILARRVTASQVQHTQTHAAGA